MKKSGSFLSVIILIAFFSNSLIAQVKSDYDKKEDFTKFKTYAFAGWQKDSDKKLNDFDKKRILDALNSELDVRGINLVKADADATITIYVVIDNKTSTTAYTTYTIGMGYDGMGELMGRGWGMGHGGVGMGSSTIYRSMDMGQHDQMGMGSSTTSYSENDYKEGTMVVDMYDESNKKLVWQGVITTTVKEKPEKREKSITKNISKLMKKYPVKPVK